MCCGTLERCGRCGRKAIARFVWFDSAYFPYVQTYCSITTTYNILLSYQTCSFHCQMNWRNFIIWANLVAAKPCSSRQMVYSFFMKGNRLIFAIHCQPLFRQGPIYACTVLQFIASLHEQLPKRMCSSSEPALCMMEVVFVID